MPATKRKSLKGGSTASDAVVKLVTHNTFEQMNRSFSNDFSIAGGAKRRATPTPKVDMNAAAAVKMTVRNAKKGGAFHASIGKMDTPAYDIPKALPTRSFDTPMTTVPFPQLELASRDISYMDVIGKQAGAGAASKSKRAAPKVTKAKAKAKAKGFSS